MRVLKFVLASVGLLIISLALSAQTPDVKHFNKSGVTFDYPAGWSLEDLSDSDAQSLRLSRTDADLQLTVFVHRGRITAEKMADAKKAFIDPYVAAEAKQFEQLGAHIEKTPDTSELGGVPAEGMKLKVTIGSDSATAQIYWALVGQHVVIMKYFGPDRDRAKYVSHWDMVRNSLKIEDPKAKPSPSPAK